METMAGILCQEKQRNCRSRLGKAINSGHSRPNTSEANASRFVFLPPTFPVAQSCSRLLTTAVAPPREHSGRAQDFRTISD